jgi:MYXO-CTERM domain-containing protein
MRRRGHAATVILGWMMLGAFVGCEEDYAREIDRCIDKSIREGKRAFWVQGEWTITGDGERSGCADEVLNAAQMDLRSQRVRVHQQGHFVFLESGQEARLPGFTFSGMVGDRCIHVKASEETPYGLITFDFPGRFLGSSLVQGEFTGKGPSGCVSKGEFTASIRLDPIPPSAIANPAPPDAGATQQEMCEDCRASCELIDVSFVDACLKSCDLYVCARPDAGTDSAVSDAQNDVVDAQYDVVDAQDDVVDAQDDVVDAQDDIVDAQDDVVDAQDDAADAQDDVVDAQDDVADAQDDAADAQDDVIDAQDDAADAQDDASDAGVAQDASDGAAVDASDPGFQYELWNGSVNDQELTDGGGSGCSVGARTDGGWGWLVGAFAWLLLRRRRRP